MKVAIFGATGGTGRIMIRKALERGHEVTAAALTEETFEYLSL